MRNLRKRRDLNWSDDDKLGWQARRDQVHMTGTDSVFIRGTRRWTESPAATGQ